MYADDHNPPHFHIEGRGWRALIAIDGFAVLAGRIGEAGAAMDWAQDKVERLHAEWDRLNTLRG
ncbi:DUF4160 domain-containing protein [Methylobacterium sp. BTF04]|nr:DUF4160 domain-containing protein [Methylobacterium sp. BTF04]